MTETVWVKLVENAPMIVTAFGVIILAAFNFFDRKYQRVEAAQARQDRAEVKKEAAEVKEELVATRAEVKQDTQEVRDTLAVATEKSSKQGDRIEATGNKNHHLLNGAAGRLMLVIADLRQEKAEKSRKPEDKKAADEARAEYDEHMRQLEASKNPAGTPGIQQVEIVNPDPVPVTVKHELIR